MAHPGFPIGGHWPRASWGGGGIDSRGGYVSKILYVKTKESGPLGGRALGTPARSANAETFYLSFFQFDTQYTNDNPSQMSRGDWGLIPQRVNYLTFFFFWAASKLGGKFRKTTTTFKRTMRVCFCLLFPRFSFTYCYVTRPGYAGNSGSL